MSVTVIYSANRIVLDSLANKPVREVRAETADVLNVPAQAQVRVNGVPADEETIVPEGASVEFVKLAGEKGGA